MKIKKNFNNKIKISALILLMLTGCEFLNKNVNPIFNGKKHYPEDNKDVYEKYKSSPISLTIKSIVSINVEEAYYTDFYKNRAGSGFIISSDGFIVTSSEMVTSAKNITVVLHNGSSYGADVIANDDISGVAIIKINESSLEPAKLSFSKLKIGEKVFSFGRIANERENTVLIKDGEITGEQKINENNYISSDINLINGMHASSLVIPSTGEVVGVNIYVKSHKEKLLSLAIPSSSVDMIYKRIKKFGKPNFGYMGVSVQEIDKKVAELFKFNEECVIISRVIKNGPAEKSGLAVGDIVIEINGNIIKKQNDLIKIIKYSYPGHTIKIKIFRNGSFIELPVKLNSSTEAI